MIELDKTTGLPFLVKRPSPEVREYSIDFKNLIPPNNTIVTVPSVVIRPLGIVSEVTPLTYVLSGYATTTQVKLILSGGTDQENYEILIAIVDSQNNTIEDSVLIKVRKANKI